MTIRHDAIDAEAIDAAHRDLESGAHVTLQWSAWTYADEELERVEELCRAFGSQLAVRFFSFRRERFDASVLRKIPSVASLTIDCVSAIDSVECVGRLEQVEEFSIAADSSLGRQVLTLLDPSVLRRLTLGELKRADASLATIGSFDRLEHLLVLGAPAGIENVGRLERLRELRLRRTPKSASLDFVSNLDGLRRLEITLGGRASIAEIACPSLEELELCWVRGFEVPMSLSAFPGLRKLTLDRLARLESIDVDGSSSLEELWLLQCKKLNRIEGLARAERLSRLRVVECPVHLEEVLSAGVPSSLREFDFWGASPRARTEVVERITALGLECTR